jgi:hypothetical protein
MTIDLSGTLETRSDQLNAVDLLPGPITVQVVSVKKVEDKKQPTHIEITGGYKTYKPCLGMRRILAAAWGLDGSAYVGRSMTLYRDPDIEYSNQATGGIRIAALSDIAKPLDIRLIESKRLPKNYKVDVIGKIAPPAPKANAKEIEELRQKMVIESEVMALGTAMGAVSDSAGMDAVRATFSRLSSKLTAEQRTALVALADAAKARIASVPVVPAEVAAAGKGELV